MKENLCSTLDDVVDDILDVQDNITVNRLIEQAITVEKYNLGEHGREIINSFNGRDIFTDSDKLSKLKSLGIRTNVGLCDVDDFTDEQITTVDSLQFNAFGYTPKRLSDYEMIEYQKKLSTIDVLQDMVEEEFRAVEALIDSNVELDLGVKVIDNKPIPNNREDCIIAHVIDLDNVTTEARKVIFSSSQYKESLVYLWKKSHNSFERGYHMNLDIIKSFADNRKESLHILNALDNKTLTSNVIKRMNGFRKKGTSYVKAKRVTALQSAYFRFTEGNTIETKDKTINRILSKKAKSEVNLNNGSPIEEDDMVYMLSRDNVIAINPNNPDRPMRGTLDSNVFKKVGEDYKSMNLDMKYINKIMDTTILEIQEEVDKLYNTILKYKRDIDAIDKQDNKALYYKQLSRKIKGQHALIKAVFNTVRASTTLVNAIIKKDDA